MRKILPFIILYFLFAEAFLLAQDNHSPSESASYFASLNPEADTAQMEQFYPILTKNTLEFMGETKVYPKPISQSLHVGTAGIPVGAFYRVVGFDGRQVLADTLPDQSISTIQVADLPAGMYFLEISFEKKVYLNQMFLKK